MRQYLREISIPALGRTSNTDTPVNDLHLYLLKEEKLMARNTGPTWRISRRLNFSVLETGEELAKRPYIPGMHGSPTRRIKQSNYGLQKAEKQK